MVPGKRRAVNKLRPPKFRVTFRTKYKDEFAQAGRSGVGHWKRTDADRAFRDTHDRAVLQGVLAVETTFLK